MQWRHKKQKQEEKKLDRNQLSAWFVQLGKRRSAEREVAGSNPVWTNTQGL